MTTRTVQHISKRHHVNGDPKPRKVNRSQEADYEREELQGPLSQRGVSDREQLDGPLSSRGVGKEDPGLFTPSEEAVRTGS
jgi:hypothetical protein